jgi:hypothetical protein
MHSSLVGLPSFVILDKNEGDNVSYVIEIRHVCASIYIYSQFLHGTQHIQGTLLGNNKIKDPKTERKENSLSFKT